MSKRRPPASLQKTKRRAFLIATAAFPLVLTIILELLLRAVAYGPDLSLFREMTVGGRRYWTMNAGVSGRYFAHTGFQPGSSPDVFLAEKPAGTIRLFCLGASTTVGYPYWYNAAFPSFLRQHLRMAFPDRHIEVVNLGLTATNSFTVLDLVREAVRYQPDALVVYDGHNEFYGALGVASRESIGRARWLVNAYLLLLESRLFLLLRESYHGLTGLFPGKSTETDRATMMEQMARGRLVPLDAALYRQGIESFGENLAATVRSCAEAGVPLLLCTQVSNLRDLPPFASLHTEALTPEKRAEFDLHVRQGDSLRTRGELVRAAGAYRAATAADPAHAGAWFRRAVVADSMGRYAEADTCYRRARDLDPVRFRASSDINAAIRAVPRPAVVVDAESLFAAHSPHGLIGSGLITEHLHPNPPGHALLAAGLVRSMTREGILAPPGEWHRRDSLPLESFLQYSLVRPVDERVARRKTEVLTSGWPFRPATVAVGIVPPGDTLGMIAELVSRGSWSWRRAHEAAAGYYGGRGESAEAAREYRVISLTFPLDVESRWRFAGIARSRGDLADAHEALLEAYRLQPAARICKALGDLRIATGDADGAIDWYRKTLTMDQATAERAGTRYILGLALLKKGDLDAAVSEFQATLTLEPGHSEAREILRRISPPGRR